MPAIYLYVDGQQMGAYTPADIRSMVASGLSGETPAWHAALPGWSTVAQVLAEFPELGVPPPVTPVAPSAPQFTKPASTGISGCWMTALIVAGISFVSFFVLAGLAIGPINRSLQKAKEIASIQNARAVDLAMFTYATDHDGAYPTGQTSTEVFQKLLDEKDISEARMFYVLMPGKLPATTNKLMAENVCLDTTAGITKDSSDEVPVVFTEGYEVTYTAGSSAKPSLTVQSPFLGIAVAYKDNSSHFLSAQPDGSVPNVIAANFDQGKETYHQLKP